LVFCSSLLIFYPILFLVFSLSLFNSIFYVHILSEKKRTYASWLDETNVWIVTILNWVKNKLREDMYVSSYVKKNCREKKSKRGNRLIHYHFAKENDQNKQSHIEKNDRSSYWSKENQTKYLSLTRLTNVR
jgi:hypothetical protein